jgi:hypothetical protein
MNGDELHALQAQLFQYVADVGEGKHFEILSIEIRHKIDVLNNLIEESIDEQNDDLSILIHVAYHYYRLLYG